MKNYMYLSVFVTGFAQAQTTSPSPYCTSQYSDDFMNVPHAVERVQFGTLDHSSGAAQYAAPHYVFYNNLSVTVNKGQTLNLTITHDDGTTIHGMAAWIDFNGDHDFDDAGEKVGETLWPGDDDPNTGNSQTYSVTVPANAVSGTTRMRIRVYEDDDYTFSGTDLPVLPCQFNGQDADWGETEDYPVTIAGGSTASLTENPSPDEYTFDQQVFTWLSEEPVVLSLVNSAGQLVSTSSGNRIDLSAVPNGVYLIRIMETDGTFRQVRLLK
ncbi:T9SS type A sorting domain-containing protein [Fluviicola sp.]|uniref:T9SS type A sorting domain-containing protein n=1 Tax=Fluviicola sp. TaxID=1917219 RepID=UPI0031CFBD5A